MNENKYYLVKVEFQSLDDKGKTKRQKVDYLVDAVSVTEAEGKITRCLIERNERNFEIKAAITSAIVDVIE
jgi:predicted HNH restriction endonuclease